MKMTYILLVAGASIFLNAACKRGGGGGGGGGGSSDAPQEEPAATPGTVSIETGEVTTPNNLLRLNESIALVPSNSKVLPPATVGTVALETALWLADDEVKTDYSQLLTRTIVTEDSKQALSKANILLCLLAGTDYVNHVGEGEYTTKVDDEACFALDNAEGGEISRKPPRPMKVNATRKPNEALVVTFSLDRGEGDQATALSGKATITKGATSTNPYGIVRLSYKTVAKTNNPWTTLALMQGVIDAYETAEGKVYFSLYNAEGVGSTKTGEQKAVVELTSEGDTIVSGQARATSVDLTNTPAAEKYAPTWFTAFNKTHYLARQTSKNNATRTVDTCYDRVNYRLDSNDYAIFKEATGKRVTLWDRWRNISRTGGTGRLTYDGVSFDAYGGSDAPVVDGDTIKVDDVDDWTVKLPYTAKVIPGYLRKAEYKKPWPLNQIKNSVLWVFGGDEVLIRYNSDKEFFEIVARKQTVEGNINRFVPLTTPEALNVVMPATLQVSYEDSSDIVNLHLNASGKLTKAETSTLPGDRTYPTSDLTLWCYKDCLRGGVSKPNFDLYDDNPDDNAQLVYYPNPANAASMLRYAYSAASGLLRDESNGKIVSADYRLESGKIMHLEMKNLIPNAFYTTLASTFSDFANLAEPRTEYTWVTGHANDSKRVYLVNSKQERLDLLPNESFVYTHTEAKDRGHNPTNTFRFGTNYLLTLTDYGDLTGIPRDSLLDADFFEGPAFSLADGAKIGGDYIVKAISVREVLLADARAQCKSLPETNALELPTGELYEDPLAASPAE